MVKRKNDDDSKGSGGGAKKGRPRGSINTGILRQNLPRNTPVALVRRGFAAKLHKLAYDLGVNQAELARRCGLGRDTINKWWNAESLPSDPHMKKLQEGTQRPQSYFILTIQDLPIRDRLDFAAVRTDQGLPQMGLEERDDGTAMVHINIRLPAPVARQIMRLALGATSPE